MVIARLLGAIGSGAYWVYTGLNCTLEVVVGIEIDSVWQRHWCKGFFMVGSVVGDQGDCVVTLKCNDERTLPAKWHESDFLEAFELIDIEVGDVWANPFGGVKVTGLELEGDDEIFVSYDILASGVSSGMVLPAFLKNYTKAGTVPKAVQILSEAIEVMAERGKSYDKTGNNAERSMPKIVAMFNALTGHELTPAQGWKFMACLKLARSEQGEHREDNYLDGAAYFALAGEEAGECDK